MPHAACLILWHAWRWICGSVKANSPSVSEEELLRLLMLDALVDQLDTQFEAKLNDSHDTASFSDQSGAKQSYVRRRPKPTHESKSIVKTYPWNRGFNFKFVIVR
jgi:hypothetical protein